jgi:hypothetical protein
MSPGQLKSLVETGHYRPAPELIAEAMLQRRGVRALLSVDSAGVSRAGQTHQEPAGHRPAA